MSGRKLVRVVDAREPEPDEVDLQDDRRTASVVQSFKGLVVVAPDHGVLIVDHPERGGAATPKPKDVAAELEGA